MNDHTGRRKFVKMATLGAGFLSSLGFSSNSSGKATHTRNQQLKMAGYDYPRVAAFFDNKVEIEGYTYKMAKGSIGDLNTNAFSGPQEFDVSEIGIMPYIIAYANDQFRDYQLLPIFPLRMFRHKSIFIHADGNIERPEDLKGKRIGTPGYSSSSLTWIRGMLQDEYGVRPEDIQWVIANKDSSAAVSGRVSKQEQIAPEGISISNGPAGKDESELLLSGEVDALFHAAQPAAFVEGNPKVIRLFQDSKKAEQEYYAKTGIFPIMHAVAVKKQLLDENTQLAADLFNAYSTAKTMNYTFMQKLGWAYDTLPWYGQGHEETMKLMGKNFYSYGFNANKKVLETICRYGFEQGFTKEQVNFQDMFYEGSLNFSES